MSVRYFDEFTGEPCPTRDNPYGSFILCDANDPTHRHFAETVDTPSVDEPGQPAVLDAARLERFQRWNLRTFGPGRHTDRTVAHIREELEEILADPGDVVEWMDVVLLAFGGALRTGCTEQDVIDALLGKMDANEERVWPDWRTHPVDAPIKHVEVES